MNTEPLFKIGWELTEKLGFNAAAWTVGEDGDLEVWADERYYIVTMPEPDTFIVTEEEEDDFNVLRDRKVWHDWTDAAHDLLDRIVGPRP